VCGDEQVSYAELNERANQLGRYLRTLGVGPEVRVGLCVERSIEMVVGLLGILKAGGAYVPLDPSSPQERLQFMLSDAGVQLVLTQESLACDEIQQHSRENFASGVVEENLVYVIYTSGSTGLPKGIMLSHHNIVVGAQIVSTYLENTPDDRILSLPKLFFSFGLNNSCVFPLRHGANVLKGRTSEMYIRGGFNIHPLEVERVVADHPKVARVAIVGTPAPTIGEIGVAFVEAVDPDDPPTLDEVRAFVRERLADYKQPDRLEVVRELPMTAMLKVDKRVLQDRLAREG